MDEIRFEEMDWDRVAGVTSFGPSDQESQSSLNGYLFPESLADTDFTHS